MPIPCENCPFCGAVMRPTREGISYSGDVITHLNIVFVCDGTDHHVSLNKKYGIRSEA